MNKDVNQRFLNESPINLPANKRDPEFHSDSMVELLSRLDIDYVFLLPGSSYRGLHDSLVNYGRNHKPKMVLTTHEQIAVSMAHGYAKATGRIGVCILHDLVGLMSGSMGVYNAFGDHVPILILGGSGPLDPAARRWVDWLHCASTQADIVKNYVKWTEEPTTPQWHLDAIAKAYKVALTEPRGPVYVTLDCGIQEQKIEGEVNMPNPKFFQPAPPVAPNPEALEAAADALLGSTFPLVVGGRFGINPAVAKPLVEFVELTGAVYRDDLGIVALPTAHPQNASGDRGIVKEADLVVALDCRDLSSLLDGYTEDSGSVGSGRLKQGRTVIDMSLNDMTPTSWSYMRGPAPLVDIQINCEPLFGLQQLNDNGGGGIGYGPGAMAGAAIACRDTGRLCVGLMGDGDFIMTAGAIWSAVHMRAPMLLVINNNTTWGNDEKHQMHVAEDRQRPMENAWIGQRMVDPDIDHATIARGYGAWSKGPIFDPSELAGVFKDAVAEVEKGHVAVVEVRTQLV